MSTPMTDSDDTARAKKMPTSRSAIDQVLAGREDGVEQQRRHQHDERRRLEDEAVGPVGDEVFLLHELGAVGQQLEQAAGAGLLRAQAALHPRHDLEQEDDAEDERGRSAPGWPRRSA